MGQINIPIPTLSGGIGRQSPTKRLSSEVEEMENCLLTPERSAEKRPPLTRVVDTQANSSYLNIPYIDPITSFESVDPANIKSSLLNNENLFTYFINVDGYNKFCIIINRCGYTFDPVTENTFEINLGGATRAITLDSFITVYRIEPTEWIKEEIETGENSGFDRGIYEYLTYGNKLASTTNPATYYLCGKAITDTVTHSLDETIDATDFGIGILLWNKLIPLDYLPDNSDKDLQDISSNADFFDSYDEHHFIHSGDRISYKISTTEGSPTFLGEDSEESQSTYWTNVRDNVSYNLNETNLTLEENGQNLLNFSLIPQYPATIVKDNVGDANGFKAHRMLHQYYDVPRVLKDETFTTTARWGTDLGYLTSPLEAVDRDLPSGTEQGNGKVYYTREAYLSRPSSFYRTIKYTAHPYIQKIRSEGLNSVLDHRRFPINIYKTSSGKWRVRYIPIKPRYSGESSSNPGPLAVKRKEKIQSLTVWKGRLWVATDHTIFSSTTDDYFDFWIGDVLLLVDSDPIDLEASIGSSNQITKIIPFQEFLFVATAGNMQFEIRGGDLAVGISIANVELRSSSFFSTERMANPQRLANNIFFATPKHVFMYTGSSSFGNEYATSVDMTAHAQGYMPNNPGLVTSSTAINSMFIVDKDFRNILYVYNFKVVGDKIQQNAVHKWTLSPLDTIVGLKAFEDDLFILVKRPSGAEDAPRKLVVYYLKVNNPKITTPMLDWLTYTANSIFDPTANLTHFILPHYDPEADTVVLHSSWDDEPTNQYQAYTTLPVIANETITKKGIPVTRLTVEGNWKYQYRNGLKQNLPVWVGRSYRMFIELSTIFGRDRNTSEVYPGVLNLKRMTLRHFNSGQYRVEIERDGRPSTSVEHEPMNIGSVSTLLGGLRVEKEGELMLKIMSFNEKTKIRIISDYSTPCNIANIDIIGYIRMGDTSTQR